MSSTMLYNASDAVIFLIHAAYYYHDSGSYLRSVGNAHHEF
jgi:hypothetical protein